MKLLHISDIHFGIKFLNRDAMIRQNLIDESYRTFDRVIDYVLNNEVKAILIAGDLFDGEYRSLRAEKYLIDVFETLNTYGVKVFYALGNHDSNTTFKNGFLKELPKNVFIFNQEKPGSYLLEDEVYIHSCGHQTRIESRNLANDFPEAKEGIFNIGLLHCSIVSKVRDENIYLPTRIQDLQNKNYDYWALGHIHKREKVDQTIYYSGNLYGLNSKETGNKGGLLITLENKEVSVDFIDFSTVNYESLKIDLENQGIKNQYDLLSDINKALKEFGKKVVLKLLLHGQSHLYTYFNDEHNCEEFIKEIKRKDKVIDVSLDTGGIGRPVDYSDFIKDDNVMGYLLQSLENKEFVEELKEKYQVDPQEETFVNELMNRMVGDSNEN